MIKVWYLGMCSDIDEYHYLLLEEPKNVDSYETLRCYEFESIHDFLQQFDDVMMNLEYGQEYAYDGYEKVLIAVVKHFMN